MTLVEQFAEVARPVLDLPIVRRTRRNHGLEHATIHILSSRIRNLQMAGRSTDSGFVLLGEADTSAVEAAVRDALRRMRGGEHSLAIHPNCGTNLVTAGFMVSMAAMVGTMGASRRQLWNRMPTVMLLAMVSLLVAQPIGMSLQRYITTDGDPGDLEVLSITKGQMRLPLGDAPITVHRVVTHSS
jgi:hypothetical protein